MQTFLPYRDFVRSARCLDWKRLGKQRVEAYQILRALRGESRGWTSHPAVLMWRGHERALEQYMRAMILEWKRRGYRNTMAVPPARGYALPSWVTPRFVRAHRSNLLRKDAGYYGAFRWGVAADLPYVWPVNTRQNMTLAQALKIEQSFGHKGVAENLQGLYNKNVGKTIPIEESEMNKTKQQHQAAQRLRMKLFDRSCNGSPETHEFKKDEETSLPNCSLLFLVLSVGMVKDEGTGAEIYCRTYGHFSIGPRGGIKVLSLRNGLHDVERKYQRQYTGGR